MRPMTTKNLLGVPSKEFKSRNRGGKRMMPIQDRELSESGTIRAGSSQDMLGNPNTKKRTKSTATANKRTNLKSTMSKNSTSSLNKRKTAASSTKKAASTGAKKLMPKVKKTISMRDRRDGSRIDLPIDTVRDADTALMMASHAESPNVVRHQVYAHFKEKMPTKR